MELESKVKEIVLTRDIDWREIKQGRWFSKSYSGSLNDYSFEVTVYRTRWTVRVAQYSNYSFINKTTFEFWGTEFKDMIKPFMKRKEEEYARQDRELEEQWEKMKVEKEKASRRKLEEGLMQL